MYVVIAAIASTALLLGSGTTVEPLAESPLAGLLGVLSYAVALLVASYVAGLLALAVACCVLRRRRHRTEGAVMHPAPAQCPSVVTTPLGR